MRPYKECEIRRRQGIYCCLCVCRNCCQNRESYDEVSATINIATSASHGVCVCVWSDHLSQSCCQLDCYLTQSCVMTSSQMCGHVTQSPVECAMGQSLSIHLQSSVNIFSLDVIDTRSTQTHVCVAVLTVLATPCVF